MRIINACARARGRHETAQHRPDTFGIDRKFKPAIFIAIAIRLARRELQKFFRINGEGIRFHRGGSGDRSGNNLALCLQTLHTRFNQSGAELVEIEKAQQQRDKAADVLEAIRSEKSISDATMPKLKAAVEAFAKSFA